MLKAGIRTAGSAGGVEPAEHGEGVGRQDAKADDEGRGGEEAGLGVGEGRDARREGQDAAADAGLDEVEGRGGEGGLVVVVGGGSGGCSSGPCQRGDTV